MMVGRASKEGVFEPNAQKHHTYKDKSKVPHVTKPLGGMLETLYELNQERELRERFAIAKK